MKIVGGEALKVEYVDHMGDDRSVVKAARVCLNADEERATSKKLSSDEKLIRYLWEHRHTSPFEHAALTVRVSAPIFVARQWHRHRTQAYNEWSARYTELPGEYYLPGRLYEQSKSNHQGSAPDMLDGSAWYLEDMATHVEAAHNLYTEMLEAGAAKEQARMILPVCTMTRFYATASLLNWLKFLDLRLDTHAQHEIRVCAEGVKRLLSDRFPVTMAVWREGHEKV